MIFLSVPTQFVLQFEAQKKFNLQIVQGYVKVGPHITAPMWRPTLRSATTLVTV